MKKEPRSSQKPLFHWPCKTQLLFLGIGAIIIVFSSNGVRPYESCDFAEVKGNIWNRPQRIFLLSKRLSELAIFSHGLWSRLPCKKDEVRFPVCIFTSLLYRVFIRLFERTQGHTQETNVHIRILGFELKLACSHTSRLVQGNLFICKYVQWYSPACASSSLKPRIRTSSIDQYTATLKPCGGASAPNNMLFHRLPSRREKRENYWIENWACILNQYSCWSEIQRVFLCNTRSDRETRYTNDLCDPWNLFITLL